MAYQQEKEGTKEPPKNLALSEEDNKILTDARKGLKECIDEESIERAKMLDDLRFCTLDQWPTQIRNARENDPEGARPCLTIDKINQYIVQVVNDVRQGKPGVNVRPQDDKADPETAKILKGLVRNIEDQSKADIAYATAVESAARIGLGFFRITTEYADDETFDQEIFIRPIPNTFAVYLGQHILPDGSDAKEGYICESMPIGKFKEQFPKAKSTREDFEELQDQITYWHSGETITVVERYCLVPEQELLYFLEDGTTISEKDYEAWPEEGGPRPKVQDRRLRVKERLRWYKMTGVEVLDKRDLPGKFIPVVEVVGREAFVDGKRFLWGLVRPAKDSLRMYNYWASTITEKIALAPKAPFIGAEGQFEGHEDKWKKANTTNYAYLPYKPVDLTGNLVPPPQRQGATPVEAAYMNYMQVIEHDVQTSLGMFKAAVGETESQQSGRAILALQRESDTGTYHFGANLGVSIRHAGRIIVDLIPHYYDTKRIVRILGEDGEVQTAQLDPELETSFAEVQTPNGMQKLYNPGLGKYDVSITVGPSYNTKRMEAAATFVEMSKGAADPISAAVLRYLTVRNSDFSGSEEAAKMLKALLPPQILQQEGQPAVPPQVQAQMQQMGQMLQMAQQKIAELESGAKMEQMKVMANHDAKMKELGLRAQADAEEARLARARAEAEIALKVWIAEQEVALQGRTAQANIVMDAQGQQHDQQMDRAGMAMEAQGQQAEQVMEKQDMQHEHMLAEHAQMHDEMMGERQQEQSEKESAHGMKMAERTAKAKEKAAKAKPKKKETKA